MMNLCNAKVNIKHGVVALLLDAKLHCDEKGLKYDFYLIAWIFIFILIYYYIYYLLYIYYFYIFIFLGKFVR